MPAAPSANEVFAANRARGRLALSVDAKGSVTRRRDHFEEGPLRLRFPNTTAASLEAVVVNTAGGMAGGDRHALDLRIGPDAALTVTTAAAEKIYRSLGPPAEISVAAALEPRGRLVWLPQETILFDGAKLDRRIECDLSPGASILVAEAVVLGRSAMGETMRHGALTDRWRIRRGGALAFAETLRLGGDLDRLLAEPAVTSGRAVVATVLAVPADEAMVERVRGQTFCGEVGVSAWNGLAVARLCAKDGAILRRDLAAVVAAMGGTLPRLWLN
jgi:urease accessory protein